jgi:hypothetical protein
MRDIHIYEYIRYFILILMRGIQMNTYDILCSNNNNTESVVGTDGKKILIFCHT